jgi:hypothetical protein
MHDLWQALAQLVADLGKVFRAASRLTPGLLLLLVWVAWWLGCVNWKKAWPVLREGGWLPALLLLILAALVWSQIAPGDWTPAEPLTLPNFWWQLAALIGLAAVAGLCGWVQGLLHWGPVEPESSSPEVQAATPSAKPAHTGATGPEQWKPAWWQRLRNWLWGYDFFISYHWESGGAYAVNLAQRLRERNFDVFLDRYEYAASDDWIKEGQRALRYSQRLIVIATRDALSKSKPVEDEIKKFTERNRRVILIYFGERFSDEDWKRLPALKEIPPSQLQIPEPPKNLRNGASDATLDELVRTHGVLRRRALRAQIVGVVISVLALAVVVVGILFIAAESAREREREARTETEITLANELLRPLGRESGGLSQPEASALRTLAGLPRKQESVRVQLLERALADPSTARRFAVRYAAILQAAVGLNEAVVAQMLTVLRERLENSALDAVIRTAAALAVAELEAAPNDLRERAAAELVSAMSESSPVVPLTVLSRSTIHAVRGLPSQRAVAHLDSAGAVLADALVKESDDSARGLLVEGLVEVCKALPRDLAAVHLLASSEPLAARLVKLRGVLQTWDLARNLVRLCQALSSDAAAKLLLEVIDKVGDSSARQHLAEGLAQVCRSLPPTRAALHIDSAAKLLEAARAKVSNSAPRQELASGLVAVCTALPSDATANYLAKALADESDAYAQRALAKGLAEVCKVLPAEKATTYLESAAKLLAAGVAKLPKSTPQSPSFRASRAEGLAQICKVLPKDRAQFHLVPVARLLGDELATESEASGRASLAEGLRQVCEVLPPDQAETYLVPAAEVLARALVNVPDGFFRSFSQASLASGLASVCRGLPPERAARFLEPAAKFLADVLLHESSGESVESLALSLVELCKTTASDRTGAKLPKVARHLAEGLAKSSDDSTAARFAFGLAEVCKLLPARRDDADLYSIIKLLDAAFERESRPSRQSNPLYGLARGLVEVHKFLPVDWAIPHLLDRRAQFSQFEQLFVSAVSELATRASLPDAVEAMKHPFCFGKVREAFLHRVEELAARKFDTRWEMVDWLRRNHPEISP